MEGSEGVEDTDEDLDIEEAPSSCNLSKGEGRLSTSSDVSGVFRFREITLLSSIDLKSCQRNVTKVRGPCLYLSLVSR